MLGTVGLLLLAASFNRLAPNIFLLKMFQCIMLKEIKKEALKHLSFREFKQLLSWLPLRYFWVISLS